MNREIKFRVWDQYENKFSYCDSHDNTCFLLTLGGQVMDGEGNSYKQSYPLQQFTGLKDTNGKDIFEGDIIKQHHGYIDTEKQDWIGAVYFGSYCCKGNDMCETGWFMKTNFQNLGFKIHKDCEVIGNIFENPELLK